MKRMVKISLFVLASLGGVLGGAIVNNSSVQSFMDADRIVDTGSHRLLVMSAKAMERQRAMTQAGGPTAGAAEDEHEEEELDYEELVARAQEAVDRQAAVVTAAVNHEAVDSGWAPAMERQISEGLVARGPTGARLISAVCKTTLCIADVEHPPGDDGMGHVSWLMVFGMSSGFFVHHSPTSTTGARTVAYLARDGHSIPFAPPPSEG